MGGYLTKKNVKMYHTHTPRKASVAERVNLSLQMLLYKMMDVNLSFKWIDYLQQAVNVYNNRRHRFLKMSPNEAELPENQQIVFNRHIDYYGKNFIQLSDRKKNQYKLDQYVRISQIRKKFDRGYKEYNTYEIFKIYKVDNLLPKTRYYLKDLLGDEVVGSFFADELVSTELPEYFLIEDIIKKRKRNNRNVY